MKRLYFLLIVLTSATIYGQTGNTGIGTNSPATKLDVNGAITNREGTALTVSGTTVTVPNLAFSQYRLTGSPGAAFTITGPTTSNGSLALVAGARMVLVNATAQIGTLNSFPILPGTAQEFTYTNGSWVATNGGARPDYDWVKAGNVLPTDPADIGSNIYHNGNVGINTTATPRATLDVNGSLAVGAGAIPNSINLSLFTFNSFRPGIGESEFVNYRGTGSGGFRFYSIPNVGAPAYPGNAIAFIDITGQYFQTSDGRVKNNISTVANGLKTVLALNPVVYNLHTGQSLQDGVLTTAKEDKSVKSIGFIAQELYKVLPEAVNKPADEANGLYAVSYTTIVPLLTKAIQEQQAQIETQEERIIQLEKEVKALMQLMHNRKD